MGPITVAILSGVAAGIGALLARRKPSEAERSKQPEERPGAATTTARRKLPPAPKGRPVQAKKFARKWLKRFAELVSPKPPPQDEKQLGRPTGDPSLSVKMAKVVNLLNRPLFYIGPLLLLWLVVDVWMRWFLAAETYAPISRYARLAVGVLAPAAVGYWTNWLAIKMLFHPRRKNAVWQGLVPARRPELVETMSQGIRERLISPEIIRDYLHKTGLLRELTSNLGHATKNVVDDPKFRQELQRLVYGRIYAFCTEPETRRAAKELADRKLREWLGHSFTRRLVAVLWGRKIEALVREEVRAFLEEIPSAMKKAFGKIDNWLDALPNLVGEHGEAIEQGVSEVIVKGMNSIDINEIVKSQLEGMDVAEFEKMLTDPVASEIVFIQTCGGLFGALVGLAIMWPPLLFGLLGCGVALFAVYRRTREAPERTVGDPSTAL